MSNQGPCWCALRGCRQCLVRLHCSACQKAHRDSPAKQAARQARAAISPREDGHGHAS